MCKLTEVRNLAVTSFCELSCEPCDEEAKMFLERIPMCVYVCVKCVCICVCVYVCVLRMLGGHHLCCLLVRLLASSGVVVQDTGREEDCLLCAFLWATLSRGFLSGKIELFCRGFVLPQGYFFKGSVRFFPKLKLAPAPCLLESVFWWNLVCLFLEVPQAKVPRQELTDEVALPSAGHQATSSCVVLGFGSRLPRLCIQQYGHSLICVAQEDHPYNR